MSWLGWLPGGGAAGGGSRDFNSSTANCVGGMFSLPPVAVPFSLEGRVEGIYRRIDKVCASPPSVTRPSPPSLFHWTDENG